MYIYVLLIIQFPKHKNGVFTIQIYVREAKMPIFTIKFRLQNAHFYNTVSTPIFSIQRRQCNSYIQVQQSNYYNPVSTVQFFTSHFRQFRFDSPTFTIQSRTFFGKSEWYFYTGDISMKNRYALPPECENYFSSTDIKTFNIYDE